MALYTMADLHLSESSGHPMDVFGARWQDYTEKITKNWRALITNEDTVVIPGDLSWAMHLEKATADFALLSSLPGKKIIGKGNHDFWWETAAKCGRFFAENGFCDISLLYNNALVVEDFILAGTRGWFLEKEQQNTVGEVDFDKITNRELCRLKLSLDAAKKLQAGEHEGKEILVFLHFPPVWGEFVWREAIDLMKQYGVCRCYFGHIHGNYFAPKSQDFEGISLFLISSDTLNFVPHRIFP